ncbi:MAG: 2TM domain-containing protein [Bacteroidota bacterium]
MRETTRYRIARKRVKRKRMFYRHLSTFLTVGTFFFMLNIMTDPFDLWFAYPMLPWGMALTFHFLSVFFWNREDEWEERAIEKEMQRLESREQRSDQVFYDDYEELELDDIPRPKRTKNTQWRDEDLV